MKECENLSKCGFFKEYENDEYLKKALQGFIDIYCKGRMQERCVRKKVSKALGGPRFVPLNMKPNGQPIIGTTDKEWSDQVKEILAQ